MDLARLKPLQDKLEHHSVYQAVRDLKGLHIFIQRERDALNIADRALRARVSFWNEVEAQL